VLEIDWTTSFKRDLKRFKHDHDLIEELNSVIEKLANSKPLLARHRDHTLTGNWTDHRECHVKNDVLLIYRTDKRNLILVRFNSHSELF
jgi:mRNA interferase YafQ